jgi:hypothetical protein
MKKIDPPYEPQLTVGEYLDLTNKKIVKYPLPVKRRYTMSTDPCVEKFWGDMVKIVDKLK